MSKRNAWMFGLAAIACGAAGTGFGVFLARSAVAAAPEAPVEKEVGGGAPTRVLIDNDTMTVTLVSFPEGFRREGGMRRRAEQLIVYVDDGAFKVEPRPGARPNPSAGGERRRTPESPITPEGEVSRNPHVRGTVAWHPKDSRTSTLVTTKAYRALYIEMKK